MDSASERARVHATKRLFLLLARQGHMVVPIQTAYRSRLASLQAEINGALLRRRDSLLRRVATIQTKAEELHAIKLGLEREARALADVWCERLRSQEHIKAAELQQLREEAQRGIDEIQASFPDIGALAARLLWLLLLLLRRRHLAAPCACRSKVRTKRSLLSSVRRSSARRRPPRKQATCSSS